MPDIEKIGAVNNDGTFDLIKIIQWRTEQKDAKKKQQVKKVDKLEIERRRTEIEYRKAQINKVNDNYVERSIADQEKIAIFKTISNFLEKIPSYRKQYFHMVSSDVAEKRLMAVFKEAMDRVADAGFRDKDGKVK